MKILVPLKRVVDPYVKIRFNPAGSAVDTAGLKMDINPFCEIAVEQAVRLKEAGTATEVLLVSVGAPAAQEQLRKGLALGADRALHIVHDAPLEPLAVAKLLAAVAAKEQPQLILAGKQSIDGDNNQTPQMLAALLGWPQGMFASAVSIKDGAASVVREVDGGLETLNIPLPCVLSADLRLNAPRPVTLPNLMKAKQKPLESSTLADWGVNGALRLQVVTEQAPPKRSGGLKVADVAELVAKLKTEAKIL